MSHRLFLLATAAMMVPSMSHAAPAAAPAAAETPAAALKRLFAESDEAALKRSPINALYRGDLRYAAHFGDYISDAYFAAERAAAQDDLKRLRAIDRKTLNETDALAYDTFEWQRKMDLRLTEPDYLALTVVRPIDHFLGWQVSYPSIASGSGAAPFKTLADYENNLLRHREYAAYLDAAIARFRQGMKSGVVQPRLVVDNVIGQLDNLIGQGVEGSIFYGPVQKFPAGITPADQARLKTAYAAAVRDVLTPAHKRLRDFLANEYRPVARESVGLRDMKGGDTLYRLALEEITTLPLAPDEVHNLGLSEVKRITREMETIKDQVGFKGTLAQFFEHIRTDPKFHPASKQALIDGYIAIGKRVDARIGEQFSTIPKTPLEIRFYEPYREKNSAGGSYEPGVWDAKDPSRVRPGIFYFNTYDLPSRTTPGMETLYLHEAAPGHHFQISLAQENEALPPFMRYEGNTAYVEGWALYAESLWRELGMETDPYQRFGGLDDEMLRAMRLVVDTGIHAKGWTRDQAIKYMLDNSSMGRTDATAEVERYIAWPGQATAYKIGQLTFLRLKAKAQKELGAKFDPRAFHAELLMTGALPMGVLERKIDAWIARVKRG